MGEPVRLVIWDLDDTFWQGTLAEEGMVYSQAAHDIVIELAKRGIMSSICSKNDFARTMKVLEERGIADYFIFPSINWEPKGPRLAQIVEAVQLRPATILFIDDNAMNLREAKHFIPDLQIEDETFVQRMLDDPRFKGKDDSQLTRLNQYKVLESKQADLSGAGGDNLAFLRSSDIRITIDHDVGNNIDRAVELINRTNQLNFTKLRLSEDPAEARTELQAMLGRYDVNTGLVSVSDKYGDYGVVGFFLSIGPRQHGTLIHFCFSCRTLNMGIETWVYNQLGRPRIKLVGETVTDIVNDHREIDWIREIGESGEDGASHQAKADSITLRGGCDLAAMSHYLAARTEKIASETNVHRDGRQFRIDHSSFVPLIFRDLTPIETVMMRQLGYADSDWTSSVRHETSSNSCWLFSFWVDSFCRLYKYRDSDLTIPFLTPKTLHATDDLIAMPWEKLEPLIENDAHRIALETLRSNFEHIGVSGEAHIKNAARLIVDRSAGKLVVFILGPEEVREPSGNVRVRVRERQINQWIAEETAGAVNVVLLRIDDFVDPNSTRSEDLHLDRMVYKSAADAVCGRILEHMQQGQLQPA